MRIIMNLMESGYFLLGWFLLAIVALWFAYNRKTRIYAVTMLAMLLTSMVLATGLVPFDEIVNLVDKVIKSIF